MTGHDGAGEIGFAESLRVRELDVNSLEPGRVHRLLVRLTSDGLGAPISVPVLVVRGEKPGPVFGLTAALHGNEINGIPVLHRLVQDTKPKKLRGTIVCVMVANLPGFFGHQRRFSDQIDLNHIMPGDMAGNVSDVWAARLFSRIVSRFDFLMDLHTASFGRVNSLYVRADMDQETTAMMARLQRPQIILHNPPSDTTLRGAAEELGIPAVTVEIGDPQRFQAKYTRRTLAGIRAVMAEVGIIGKRKVAPLSAAPIVCTSSFWIYTDHGGLLEVFPDVTETVKKGQVVAKLSNIFGDVIREYEAPEDGIVIGKSVNPVGETGARILHLGRIAEGS